MKERSNEVQLELNEAKRILEEKTREKELEKKNYQSQVERNSPELKCLEELTGCMIRGTKNKGGKFFFQMRERESPIDFSVPSRGLESQLLTDQPHLISRFSFLLVS